MTLDAGLTGGAGLSGLSTTATTARRKTHTPGVLFAFNKDLLEGVSSGQQTTEERTDHGSCEERSDGRYLIAIVDED